MAADGNLSLSCIVQPAVGPKHYGLDRQHAMLTMHLQGSCSLAHHPVSSPQHPCWPLLRAPPQNTQILIPLLLLLLAGCRALLDQAAA
jgi:hypothetical protein